MARDSLNVWIIGASIAFDIVPALIQGYSAIRISSAAIPRQIPASPVKSELFWINIFADTFWLVAVDSNFVVPSTVAVHEELKFGENGWILFQLFLEYNFWILFPIHTISDSYYFLIHSKMAAKLVKNGWVQCSRWLDKNFWFILVRRRRLSFISSGFPPASPGLCGRVWS